MPHAPAAKQSDELFARSVEHGTVYSIVMTEEEAQSLAEGVITESLQERAKFAVETTEQMMQRKRRKA